MSKFIVRLGEDQFVLWSDTVDAPTSYVMSADELAELPELARHQSPAEIAHAIETAIATGTSSLDIDFEDVIETNRAGENETQLTVEAILRRYDRTNIA